MIFLFAACASTPTGSDSGPVDTADTSANVDPCVDAPHLTWESFGQGFLTAQCQTCHASTAPDRHGAPDEVTFDTVEQAWLFADSILSSSTGGMPSMPPAGGVSEDDRQRLTWWLRCGTPGS